VWLDLFLSSWYVHHHHRTGSCEVAEGKFFDEQTEQSEVKARIVEKYFYAWARVIMPTAKKWGNPIAYIDLFAGPGRYKDGAMSTPLLVLQRAIQDANLSETLVTLFNDGDPDHVDTLRREVEALPGVERLKHKPEIMCGEIDQHAERYFNTARLVPTFSFVDPFGYRGLSLQIINGVIKDWGCDCVFFFNYGRINSGLGNPAVETHMNALFGVDRANRMRTVLPPLRPDQREMVILEELAQALKDLGGKYVLPFRFRNSTGTRTTHCLVFVTKHFKGYEIMKGIMAAESSTLEQGVPSLTYSPADATTPLLFSLSRPLDALEGLLLARFAGRTLTMKRIYETHSVDTPYLDRNYKEVLVRLEAQRRIAANPPATRRPRRGGVPTFADHVEVTFPVASA
jgi:three-Cys-motif partner protein